MAETSRPLPRSAWVGYSLVFSLIGLGILVSILQSTRQHKTELPIIGPVADFTLTNQDGKVSTLADFTNHVWVADIVFTRCAGPCPRMTQQMKSVADLLSQDSNARLVTLTTDPEFDTPEQFKKFGGHYGADFSRWTFLTGDKLSIGRLAANSLKLAAQPVKLEDQKDAADLFIHTTIFTVVDKHARLRGSFETGGDGVDWTNDVLPKVIAAVRQLESEP
jgi:cytochrome oxidase Cu insertion factor (SCO1/SenC/PrrC family)